MKIKKINKQIMSNKMNECLKDWWLYEFNVLKRYNMSEVYMRKQNKIIIHFKEI